MNIQIICLQIVVSTYFIASINSFQHINQIVQQLQTSQNRWFPAANQHKDDRSHKSSRHLTIRMTNKNNNKNDDDVSDDNQTSKFSFEQRIESTKTALVGLLSGGIALTPFAAIRDIVFMGGGHSPILNGIAQWEFDTDMGSVMAALFAIVYRYCIREGDNNPQLNQGVLGAFVLTRTLSQIQVPSYCSAIPLDCTLFHIKLVISSQFRYQMLLLTQ
jgi:hypothetical protein